MAFSIAVETVCPVAGIALDVLDLANAVKEKNTLGIVLGVVGFIPVVGTLAKKTKVLDKVLDAAPVLKKASGAASEVLKKAGNAASDVLKKAGNSLGDLLKKGSKKASDAAEAAKKGVSSLADKAGNALKNLFKKGSSKADDAAEAAQKAAKTSYGKSSSNCTELVPYYPANNGAVLGTEKKIYLMAGDKIDRFGGKKGKFFSPTGTPMEMRALPYDADLSQYRQFEVIKPFEVEASTIAPAFGNIGLGTQYRSSVSVEVLLKKGIIKQVGGNK